MNEWCPPEVLTLYSTGGFHGKDRDGSPIYIKPAGLIDIKGSGDGLGIMFSLGNLFSMDLHKFAYIEIINM